MPSAYCLLLSILVLILIFVVVFFDDIQFNRIQANNLQLNSTLFTFDDLALVDVSIDVDISFAFWATSSRHLIYLQNTIFKRDESCAFVVFMKPSNLTAGQSFLQYEFLREQLSSLFQAKNQILRTCRSERERYGRDCRRRRS